MDGATGPVVDYSIRKGSLLKHDRATIPSTVSNSVGGFLRLHTNARNIFSCVNFLLIAKIAINVFSCNQLHSR